MENVSSEPTRLKSSLSSPSLSHQHLTMTAPFSSQQTTSQVDERPRPHHMAPSDHRSSSSSVTDVQQKNALKPPSGRRRSSVKSPQPKRKRSHPWHTSLPQLSNVSQSRQTSSHQLLSDQRQPPHQFINERGTRQSSDVRLRTSRSEDTLTGK